jgi:hypothetical protein
VNRLRRAAVLTAAALAVTLGLSAPAQAALTDTAPKFTASVTTIKVAAPTSVSTGGTKCTTTYNATTGTSTTTLNAKVSWPASTTSRGVTGYVVTAVFSDGTKYPVAQVSASTTSLSGDYDASYASQNIRVTVTTLTAYGWTAESAPSSGVIKC